MTYAEEHIFRPKIFYAKYFMQREILRARWLLICQLTFGQSIECMLAQRRVNVICPTCPMMRQHVGIMLRQHVGPTMLGQRSLSTFGQRSGQPKYSFGPTLSCYLGRADITGFFFSLLYRLFGFHVKISGKIIKFPAFFSDNILKSTNKIN